MGKYELWMHGLVCHTGAVLLMLRTGTQTYFMLINLLLHMDLSLCTCNIYSIKEENTFTTRVKYVVKIWFEKRNPPPPPINSAIYKNNAQKAGKF